MSDLKLEAGKYFRTRGGRKAYLLGRFPEGVCGGTLEGAVVCDNGDWDCIGWGADGRIYADGRDDADDLVAEWIEPVAGAEVLLLRFTNGRLMTLLAGDELPGGTFQIIGRKTVTLTEGEGV